MAAYSPANGFVKNVSVLAIGVESVGKSMLAKALLKESSRHETPPINMKVNLLSKISPDFDLLDIDLVIVLIDLTKKSSLEVLEHIDGLEYRHLLGKLCFVVLGTKQLSDRVLNVGDIQPQLNESEFAILSPKLMNIVLVTSGLKPLSPTIFSWNCAHPISVHEDLIGDT